MERLSGGRMTGITPVDPVEGWTVRGGENGLLESMWQLDLGGEPQAYPERPDKPDCIYYLKRGFCGYGTSCRYNHPDRRAAVEAAIRASGGVNPERVGQPVCQYYMRGNCKFGARCKKHHPRLGGGPETPMALNIYGYPLRQGERECAYYLKTGDCRFGVSCRFHHPQPTWMSLPLPLPAPGPSPLVLSGGVPELAANWPVPVSALLPDSYPPGLITVPDWTSCPAPIIPVGSDSSQPTFVADPMYGITQLSASAPPYTGPYDLPAGPSGRTQQEHQGVTHQFTLTTFGPSDGIAEL